MQDAWRWDRGLWLLVGAAALHVLEEYLLDWPGWAEALSGRALSWELFWIGNAGFLTLALGAALLGARRPELSLALPWLTLINGVFFHIGPTVFLGRLSPGVFTSMLLYVPISAWVFWHASKADVLTQRVAVTSAALGATLMALPLFFFAIL